MMRIIIVFIFFEVLYKEQKIILLKVFFQNKLQLCNIFIYLKAIKN